MKLSDTTLQHMEALEGAEVASWIADSFLKLAQREARRESGPSTPPAKRPADPFTPHEWVHHVAPTPATAIQSLYAQGSLELQRSIHAGIEKLGALCRAGNHQTCTLPQTQRLGLLKTYLELSVGTVCLVTTRNLSRIACQDPHGWETDLFRRNIFPDCLLALEDLALAFDTSPHKSNDHARELTAALYQLVGSDAFRPEYSPRLIAALSSVNPEGLLDHLKLLGPEVSKMHRKFVPQRQYAYLTAERIVKVGLRRLQEIFPELQLEFPTDRDHWLFQALFEDKGPLKGFPIGHEDAICVLVGGSLSRRMEFRNPRAMAAFQRSFPNARPPEARSDHPSQQLLTKYMRQQPDYYGTTKRNIRLPRAAPQQAPASGERVH